MINPYEPVASVTDEVTPAKPKQPSPIFVGPMSWLTRTALILGGIVIPVGCHLLSLPNPPDTPLWQTGALGDKLTFILSPQAGFVFYPMLLYSIASLTFYLIRDGRQRVGFWIRMGIYGGVLIALWYSIIFDIVVGTDYGSTLGGLVWLPAIQFGIPLLGWGIITCFRWLHRTSLMPIVWAVVAIFGLGGIAIGIASGPGEMLSAIVMLPIMTGLFCGPVWALLAYGFVSLRLWLDPRKAASLGAYEVICGVLYVAVILAACPMSVMLSLNKYSTLPVQPVSRCYVVTAAARGHRRFVGSWVHDIDDVRFPNNLQLHRLRAFECLLSQASPRGHRLLRYCYDRIGPKLAACISNPWLADLAYISLKPIEWIAAITLFGAVRLRKTRSSHTDVC